MALHPGERKRHLPEAPVVWDPIRRDLKENEDWYRDLVEHSQDLLCVHDLEGRLLSVNPAPARLLGYSVEEALRMRILDVIDPQFREQCEAYLREVARTGESHGLLAVVTKTGEQRIWKYHSTLRTEGVAAPIVRGMAHDVTERVRAEKALRATNEQMLKTAQERERVLHELTLFRTLLDQSNDAIQVVDPETRRFLDVNERACIELGYSRDELLSMTVFDIDPDYDESSRARMEQLVRESGFATMERVHRRKDGTTFPVEVNLRRVRLDRDYCVAVSRDITERVRAEKALRATNEHLLKTAQERERVLHELTLFRTLLDQSNDAIEVIDPETMRFLDVNESACAELGYSREELLSMTVLDISPGLDKSALARVGQQLRESGFVIMEKVRRRKDGTTFPVEVNLREVLLDRKYGVAVVRDITERKRADEALRQRDEAQKLILDHLSVGVILSSGSEQKAIYHNPRFLELFGYSLEQFTNVSEWWPLAYPDPAYREWVSTEWNRRVSEAAKTQGEIEPMEVTITCHDGTKKYVRVTAKFIGGLNFVSFIDLTERKRAEEALRASKEELQNSQANLAALFESATDLIWSVDSKCRLLAFNAKLAENFRKNHGKEVCVGDTPQDLLPPDRAAKWPPMYDRALAEGPFHQEYSLPDGRILEMRFNPLLREGEAVGVSVFAKDITEHKRAEKALRESERRFRAVYEKSPVGIALVDTQTRRFLQANPKFCAIVGRSEEELLQLDMVSITHPDDVEISNEYMRGVIQEKLVNFGLEKRYLRPDGSVRWGRVLVVPMWCEEEKHQIRITLLQDITEQKRATEALQESEERYRSIVSAMAEGVLLRDADGRILACNRSFEPMLGVTSEQMVGTTAADWEHRTIREDGSPFPGEDHPAIVALRTGRPQSNICMGFRRQDEGLTWVSINAQPIFRSGESKPHAVVTSFTDITEQKRAQEAIATLVQVRADSSGNFFTSMAIQLAKCLEADYTFIGELVEGEEAKLRTLGVCGQGAIVENYTYDLAHSPSETVILQGARSYVSGVAELFPKNEWLQQTKMESYTGTPLRDSQGRVIGVMVALYKRPLADAKFAEMILQLFSTRTAAEIERKRAEEALRQSEERFRVALNTSPTAVFNQDRDLRYTWMYNPQLPRAVSEYLGKTSDEIFDPEDAARITEVRRRVLETGVGSRHEMQFSFGGKKRYFDTTIEPVLDAAGAVIGITGATTDVTELREKTEALREAKKKLTEEKLYLEQEINTELGFGDIIGQSKALEAVMENVGKVAASNATVLLLGETGTGKELVARAIHWLSLRAGNSFIKLNCAAIPTGLLESELFGNEKGAFTGAVSKKIGRIELADKGTLFLDEIGEISLALQPKLLRVLQDQEFERLGGTHTLKVDFRLIAATNRDLADAVRQNEFRSDLYYRLNVFPIRVPPLRERREDIRLLVEHFVQKFARRMNKSITSVPMRTMDALMGWEWPGNVRELENFIERSVILTQGSVLVAPLSELEPMDTDENADETLEATEREHILRALRESHGQIGGPRGAAMRLGLKRTTLQSKLKHFGINPRSKPPQP